jgi:hypothetical protein
LQKFLRTVQTNYFNLYLVSEPSPGGPRTRSRHARRQAHVSADSEEAEEGLTDDDNMEVPAGTEHGAMGPEIVGKQRQI